LNKLPAVISYTVWQQVRKIASTKSLQTVKA